jgi:hypothetical protein
MDMTQCGIITMCVACLARSPLPARCSFKKRRSGWVSARAALMRRCLCRCVAVRVAVCVCCVALCSACVRGVLCGTAQHDTVQCVCVPRVCMVCRVCRVCMVCEGVQVLFPSPFPFFLQEAMGVCVSLFALVCLVTPGCLLCAVLVTLFVGCSPCAWCKGAPVPPSLFSCPRKPLVVRVPLPPLVGSPGHPALPAGASPRDYVGGCDKGPPRQACAHPSDAGHPGTGGSGGETRGPIL